MSYDSREERERLKEEYKEHYRKMKETREQLSKIQKQNRIADALNNMDTAPLMDTFDEFLHKVKSKLANVEARLDVAMDSLVSADDDFEEVQQHDDEMVKERAKETLRQAKIEMGLLYSEIEQQADAIKVEKTIGTRQKETGEDSAGGKSNETTQGQ